MSSTNLCDAATLPRYPTIFVFKDSTVDPSNNDFLPAMIKSNFFPYGQDFPDHIPTGRFTNGRLITNFLASLLEIKELLPPYMDPMLSKDKHRRVLALRLLDWGWISARTRAIPELRAPTEEYAIPVVYHTVGCCGSGFWAIGPLCNAATPTCSNPSQFIFWDAVHPTEEVYKVAATLAADKLL
ncbi:hypothetical protein GIB67_020290 [Kingdonia uniflora]|uniref:GDSL esterase/lipase n=1 Tax=Kingdonia uniflora TaxID=39325 RepID=A0A7J7P4K8_9MAGN|nr:hypothetical protein GIB67_020290 [Kingdonia uniflora]